MIMDMTKKKRSVIPIIAKISFIIISNYDMKHNDPAKKRRGV
ncbi:MAG: hypothetical protein ACI8Q1_003502 [Parvicella sp.]|jgi:hypothetical protein